MTTRTGTTILGTLLGASLSLAATTAAAEDDFTGVWEAFTTLNTHTTPMSADGQKLVDDWLGSFGDNYVEPGSFCVPPGLMGIMTATVSYPVEVIHSEDRVTLLTEYDMQVRRIFLDGREFPDNYPATRMGYSIGEWNGEVLEVETTLLSDWLMNRWPRSEHSFVSERIYMTTIQEAEAAGAGFNGFVQPAGLSDDVLVFEYTVEDPTFWAEPQKVATYYQRIPDDSFLEYDCPADLWRRGLSGELEWNMD